MAGPWIRGPAVLPRRLWRGNRRTVRRSTQSGFASAAMHASRVAVRKSRFLRQRVNDQVVGSNDRGVLLAVAALVGDRIGISSPFQPGHPQRLPRLRLERAKAIVIARADEQHVSRGDDGPR